MLLYRKFFWVNRSLYLGTCDWKINIEVKRLIKEKSVKKKVSLFCFIF